MEQDEPALDGWEPDDNVIPAVLGGGRTAADLCSADVHWAVVDLSQDGLSVLQIADALDLSVRWVKRIRADTLSSVMVTLRDSRIAVTDAREEARRLREELIRRTT